MSTIPAQPDPEQIRKLTPKPSVMDNLDQLFTTDPIVDPPPKPVTEDERERKEWADANTLNEKGFLGRGVVKIKPKRGADLPYRTFLKTLGDDEDHSRLKTALSAVDTSAANRALRLLFNPKYSHLPLETILKKSGIGIPQLRDIWRKARLDEGYMNLLNAYPTAMKDVAKDAQSTREACRFCGGIGQIVDETKPPRKVRGMAEPQPVMIDCHTCEGLGWVRKPGDKDARALMGQILGVSGKTGPLISTTTNILNLESVIGDIEHMQKSVTQSKGIYDVEAEPLDQTE